MVTPILTECVFCKIVSGEQSSQIIFEDDRTLGFLDIRPIQIGHTLVIPKKHYETILDIPDDELANLIIITKKIANHIKNTLGATGFRIANNNYRPAGQIIPHIHFHIVPVTPEAPFKLRFQRKNVTIDDLVKIAAKLKMK